MSETSASDAPTTGAQTGAEPGRACGYSRCDQRITYTGSGRPREYCGPPDRVWPDGKTCKQKAQEERRAAHAAGVDGALDLFDAAAAPVLAVAGTLGGTLADLQRALEGHSLALGAVRDGAVARVREAEQAAAEALAKAAAAEAERERAVRAAAAAEREREQAVEAKRVAERMARDAEAERERQVNAAWTRVVEHEAARAAAEQKAAQQTAAATHALALREEEWQRAEQLQRSNRELEKANRDLGKELAVARAQGEAADQAKATAEAAAGQARAELDREREQHADQADRLRQDLAAARAELAQARQQHAGEATQLREDLAAAREQLGEARGQLTVAQAEARSAGQQAEAAETRAAELLQALRGRGGGT
ncbi:hypothetical protein [Nonomuraea sp. NPDC005650]|uniref:hypothetical protein n=1 Tax=Nonomuraea sp. NPDC005650 TaxID=3157045 RepID=UPI0033AF083B